MSIDYLNEIEVLKRNRAIFETKAQKHKLEHCLEANLYKSLVMQFDVTIEAMKVLNKNKEINEIQQILGA